MRGDNDLQAEWRATADEIRADILEHGAEQRGVLRQHYDTDALDASTLLAPLFGFFESGDERAHSSVLAIADELTEDGFVLRYRTDETDDGLTGKEGSVPHLLVLARLGAVRGGRAPAGPRPVRAAPAGRLAPRPVRRGVRRRTGYHLGNFPQAFSHLALIEAAGRIILAEWLPEFQ